MHHLKRLASTRMGTPVCDAQVLAFRIASPDELQQLVRRPSPVSLFTIFFNAAWEAQCSSTTKVFSSRSE
jgi:hypothetical protein